MSKQKNDEERAAFEAWWTTTKLGERNQAWLGWLARAALADAPKPVSTPAAEQPICDELRACWMCSDEQAHMSIERAKGTDHAN